MSKNRHQGNGTTVVASPAQPKPVATVGPVEDTDDLVESSSGEQLALQLINSLEGDMRLTIATQAFSAGQKRIKRLKQQWDAQITELKSDWSEDDAELLKMAIQGQRTTLIQMFVSMNPTAFNNRKVRDQLASTVDKLIDATVAKIVAPSDPK